MFQHGDVVLCQKCLDRQGIVRVLVKNSWAVLTHFRSYSHPFTNVCQNLLVVHLVDDLTFRHPIHVTIPLMLEKTTIIALNLDLLCRAFFCLGELGLFQCMDWRLLSGLYWKNHDSAQVITFSKTCGSFSVLKNVSMNVHSNFLLFRSEESRHHLQTHFFMFKSLCKICQFPCQC